MNKKDLKFKNKFLYLKGEIVEHEDEKKRLTVNFDLTETFENPEDKNLELDFTLKDSAEIKKLEIEIKNGEAKKKEDALPAKREDIKKGDYVLVSFLTEDDLFQFLENEDSRNVDNLLIYK